MESQMEPQEVENAIDKLFPQFPLAAQPYIQKVGEVPTLSTAEIDAAIERCKMSKWKAPGPDNIPNAVWCAIHKVAPFMFSMEPCRRVSLLTNGRRPD